MPREVSRRYWCPYCDAQPGELCRGTRGPRKASHIQRVRYAKSVMAGESPPKPPGTRKPPLGERTLMRYLAETKTMRDELANGDHRDAARAAQNLAGTLEIGIERVRSRRSDS